MMSVIRSRRCQLGICPGCEQRSFIEVGDWRGQCERVECGYRAELSPVGDRYVDVFSGEPFDRFNQEMIASIAEERDGVANPRCGDYVRFADGSMRRISHVWKWDSDDPALPNKVQTSWGGSWHMTRGGASFSGSLYGGPRLADMRLTTESKPGQFWVFDRDEWGAGRGIYFEAPCRVYECDMETAPR